MSWQVGLRVPLDENLLGFIKLLRYYQIAHRVSEEGGQQVLWVADVETAERVQALYREQPQGLAELALEPLETSASPRARVSFFAQLKASWLTSLILLLTLLATLLSQFGSDHSITHWLTFQNYRVEGDYAYFEPLMLSLEQGQWWRLFSPALLHLSWLHLAMNSLWYWELGRRVEYRQGRLALLGLTLLFAVLSNAAQYSYSGVGIFGGLSGVLYGLLGYCWVFQRLAPTPVYALPQGVMALMLIWLVVCMTGVTQWLGLGAIANAAHVGGLLSGLAAGLFAGALARARQ